jgi:hypothetical protein
MGETAITTVLDVAGLAETHARFEFKIQLTLSLFSGMYENVAAEVPVLTPFTNHKYCGDDPPLTGTELIFTTLPWHILFLSSMIETLTGTIGLTSIAIGFEVAGVPVEQFKAEVKVQLTISPFAGV